MAEEKIGSYKVLKPMGAGGMAKVFLAVHEDVPNLKVILKILDDPLLGERFIQEADKLALLDGHPSVCRIKHFFRHGEKTVIAMEYIDGETLDDRLKNQGMFAFDEAARICSDVLDTLHFAHRKGIFHRDIKPGNIMIDHQGRVKVIDFGIAKAKTDPDLTRAGTACGTPAYMSPEQFTPNETTNYALADVYAVGTTLFKLVTGQLPFPGDNEFAIRDAKIFNEPPKPSGLRKDIPKGLEQTILKAMKREPENRYQNAMEMREALLKAVKMPSGPITPPPADDESTQGVTTDRIPPVLPTPKPAGGKRKSRLPLLVGIAVVVALAAAAYFYFQPRASALPSAPLLAAPLDQLLIDNTNRPAFAWSRTSASAQQFELEYALDSAFSDPVRKTGLRDTFLTLTEPLANADYWWRVRAVNDKGEPGPYSVARNITIALPVPQGTLSVKVNRAADIFANNELVADRTTAYEATVDTGVYDIRVENASSNEKRLAEQLRVPAGQTATAEFRFTFPQVAPPTEPQPTTAKLVVVSYPLGAAIFVDGQIQREVSTPMTLTVSPGTHLVKVVLLEDGERSMGSSVEVKAGRENKVMFNFERDTVLFDF